MKAFLLSFWRNLFANRNSSDSSSKIYHYEDELIDAVRELAFQEERPEEDVTADLLSLLQARKEANERMQVHWNLLSYREQQVAALACLGYSNRQIAYRLSISTHTVATHIRSVLHEFDLHSKMELREALAGWDFSIWDSTC